jgi:HPt (histidine-containing phosphotransfer) domain-containing protein
MIKPITLASLRAVFEQWAPAASSASPGVDSFRSDEDRAGSALARHLEELISETDAEFVRELIGLFVQNGAVLLEEMVLAHEASDWGSLERAAHSLKGASNNIGAAGLARLCLRLEKAAANHEGTMDQVGEIRQVFLSTETELQAFGSKQ